MHLISLLILSLALLTLAKRDAPAPIIKLPEGRIVKGRYIVRFRNNVGKAAIKNTLSSITAKPKHLYSDVFDGFSVRLTNREVKKLQSNPYVKYIEQDGFISEDGATIKDIPEHPAPKRKISWDWLNLRKLSHKDIITQKAAPWGLARISNSKPFHHTYTYDKSAGTGTCVYVIDSGIDTKNLFIRNRVHYLARFAGDHDDDGTGHGTHVAGTIGACGFGVAQNTTLFAVKVFDNNGLTTMSNILAGMDFVAKDAASRAEMCPKGIVVNMSLSGPRTIALNEAAEKITNAGLFLSAAAGNRGIEAYFLSPASAASVCTVGATSKDDTLAIYSNWGPLVNVLAPGTDVKSLRGGTLLVSKSGTSMASAHVAGLAAYFLGLGKSIDGLCEYIASMALKDVVNMEMYNGTETPNLLINNGFKGKNGNFLGIGI